MPKPLSAKAQQHITYLCSTCGSEDIVVDSWAAWDAPNQRWRVSEVFESTAYCRTCDGECTLREVSVSGRASVA
jgi:hypothetical protein